VLFYIWNCAGQEFIFTIVHKRPYVYLFNEMRKIDTGWIVFRRDCFRFVFLFFAVYGCAPYNWQTLDFLFCIKCNLRRILRMDMLEFIMNYRPKWFQTSFICTFLCERINQDSPSMTLSSSESDILMRLPLELSCPLLCAYCYKKRKKTNYFE